MKKKKSFINPNRNRLTQSLELNLFSSYCLIDRGFCRVYLSVSSKDNKDDLVTIKKQ